MRAIDHHKSGCPTDTSLPAAVGPPGISGDLPALADGRACSRIGRTDRQQKAAVGSDDSAGPRKPLNVLGQSGNSLHVDGPDELVARMAAAIDAGDRQLLVTLARKLVDEPHAQDGDDENLLTIAEVAHDLRVSIRTVWRVLGSDKCKPFPKPFRVGRSLRWRRADIEGFMVQPNTRR